MQHDEHEHQHDHDAADEVAVEAGFEDEAGVDEAPSEPETPEQTIARLEREADEFREKWMRAMADFRNFQQRSRDNEKQAREDGRTAVLRGLMPALDNLDLALAQSETGTPAEQLVQGMASVAGQLREAFGTMGVQVVRPEPGGAFDHHQHQAVLQQPSDDVEPGCIVGVLQSGYVMGDRVLRPAGVIVAIDPPAGAGDTGDDAGADEA